MRKILKNTGGGIKNKGVEIRDISAAEGIRGFKIKQQSIKKEQMGNKRTNERNRCNSG